MTGAVYQYTARSSCTAKGQITRRSFIVVIAIIPHVRITLVFAEKLLAYALYKES